MKNKYFPYRSENKLPYIFYLILILTSCLVFAAGRGELWFDEIWSLLFAEASSSLWEVFQIRHDNNQLLNTLYLYIIGEQERFYFYRLFSMICGIGTIYLIGLKARTWGRTESIIALLLTGTSYPLILYFSEARGYSPAIFFALSTFILLQKYEVQKTPLRLICIWALIALGVLSHLTFIIFLLSLFIYSVSLSFINKSQESLLSKTSNLLIIYFIPFIFIAALYFFFIQNLTLGSWEKGVAASSNKIEVLYSTGEMLLGLPDQITIKTLGLVFLLLSTIAAIIVLYRSKNHLWIFFTSIIFIVPVLLVLVTKPPFLFFRYFIICFPFYYLLLSYLLGQLYQAKFKFVSYAVILVITSMLVGHSFKILPLLQYGRGSYKKALEYITQNTTNSTVMIGSDHDFRNGMLVDYYSRFMPPETQPHYINIDRILAERPEWFITHNQDSTYLPPRQIIINESLTYNFIKKFSYANVSGWNWYIYRL